MCEKYIDLLISSTNVTLAEAKAVTM